MRAALMEWIGTFFLVLAIVLSEQNPLAIGLTLMAMAYVGGHLSGGHYNPAVTLTAWLRGSTPGSSVLIYLLMQLLGGLGAVFLAASLTGQSFTATPKEGVSIFVALIAELLFTLALCSVFLAVTSSKKFQGGLISGVAVGGTLVAGLLCVEHLSGGVFNPAVATSSVFFDLTQGGSTYSSLWIYWVAPYVGAILAAYLFLFLEE